MSAANEPSAPRSHWRKANNWIRIITLAAVLTYTGFQMWQTFLIRSSNLVSERAFVSPSFQALVLGNTPGGAKNSALGVFIALTNNGATPTLHLRTKIVCAPSLTAAVEPWDLLSQYKTDTLPQFIGAKASATVQCSFPMDQVVEMSKGMLHGYILGDVTYYDQIDPSVRHRTEYAYELFYPTITTINGVLSVSSVATGVGTHNCADEECPVN